MDKATCETCKFFKPGSSAAADRVKSAMMRTGHMAPPWVHTQAREIDKDGICHAEPSTVTKYKGDSCRHHAVATEEPANG